MKAEQEPIMPHQSGVAFRIMRNRSVKHTRIIVTHYGGPDALQVLEEECPEPKAGEVRVRVLAAGVSLPDLMMREGIHPETPALPFTPGWDLVGVVDRLGAGVSGIEPGQIVAALPISGAYAEFVCLPQLSGIPSGEQWNRRAGEAQGTAVLQGRRSPVRLIPCSFCGQFQAQARERLPSSWLFRSPGLGARATSS